MTQAEMAFARRICNCCNCDHYWVRRGEKEPRRCPGCFSTQWNLPTLRAFATANDTTAKAKEQGRTQ